MDDDSMLCSGCHPGYRWVGNVVGDFDLAVSPDGQFELISASTCEKYLRFDAAPSPLSPARQSEIDAETGPELTAEEFEADSAWVDAALAAMAPLAASLGDLRGTWRLVETCREAGWDAEDGGYVELWIFQRCGELVRDSTT